LAVTKKSAPKAQSPVLTTDALEIGDARKGLNYARKVCAACHNVQRSDAKSPNSKTPPFKQIANTPGMSVTALTVWSRTMHPTMPNLIIEPNDMDDLIAYVLSLKDNK
jgi:mono/diheme cytochrome c family protein